MDEVRIIRRRTYAWPVIIALIILALVIAFAFITMNGAARSTVGWNGQMEWSVPA
jgi:multisubunit Na+/H+ antiporter MnhC subunit